MSLLFSGDHSYNDILTNNIIKTDASHHTRGPCFSLAWSQTTAAPHSTPNSQFEFNNLFCCLVVFVFVGSRPVLRDNKISQVLFAGWLDIRIRICVDCKVADRTRGPINVSIKIKSAGLVSFIIKHCVGQQKFRKPNILFYILLVFFLKVSLQHQSSIS